MGKKDGGGSGGSGGRARDGAVPKGYEALAGMSNFFTRQKGRGLVTVAENGKGSGWLVSGAQRGGSTQYTDTKSTKGEAVKAANALLNRLA